MLWPSTTLRRRSRERMVLVALSLIGLSLCGADLPPAEARGCGGGESLAAPPGDEPVERWRYVDPQAGHYDVTGVDDGVVYVGSLTPGCALGFSGFAALDAATGEPIWELAGDDIDGEVSGTIEQFDDRIVFPIFGENDLGLVAVDANSGEPVWRVDGRNGTPDAVGVVDGLLITSDTSLDATVLTGLDIETGANAWALTLDGYADDVFLDDDLLALTLRSGEIDVFRWTTIALDPATGDVRWTLPEAESPTAVQAESDGMVYAVLGDTFASIDGVVALDAATGDTAWAMLFETNDAWRFAGMTGAALLLRGGDEALTLALMAVDLDTGNVAWTEKIAGRSTETPDPTVQISDDLAVTQWIDADEGVATLRAVDLDTGDGAWTSEPVPAGLGAIMTVSDETGQAYLAADYGGASAITAVELDDGVRVWSVAYPHLGSPQIEAISTDSLYLTASTADETVLIALKADELIRRQIRLTCPVPSFSRLPAPISSPGLRGRG